MGGPERHDLPLPPHLEGVDLLVPDAIRLLSDWHHPRPRRWLQKKVEENLVPERGSPPRVRGEELWRELLRDECDKLYNQAWCALDQIRSADSEDEVLLLAIDELPSSVEQAYSLAPAFAGEHLALLRDYRQERYENVLRELAVGTDREVEERIECLRFWEDNAEGMSDLRRTLFRLVREGLLRGRS